MLEKQEELTKKPETVEEFLTSYGIDFQLMSEKQKLKALHEILIDCKAIRDLVEMNYDNNKDTITKDDFVEEMRKIDITEIQTKGFIGKQYIICKEERRTKRKENLNKVKMIFKKR